MSEVASELLVPVGLFGWWPEKLGDCSWLELLIPYGQSPYRTTLPWPLLRVIDNRGGWRLFVDVLDGHEASPWVGPGSRSEIESGPVGTAEWRHSGLALGPGREVAIVVDWPAPPLEPCGAVREFRHWMPRSVCDLPEGHHGQHRASFLWG
jgi:hypothetical protein